MSLPVRLDEDGAAAPPRENGELAFSAPWEGRLFGLTMTLVEAGRLGLGGVPAAPDRTNSRLGRRRSRCGRAFTAMARRAD